MSLAHEELRGSLVRLRAGGLQAGLSAAQADRLVAGLEEGRPLASDSGLDPRLAQAVRASEVRDVPAALTALLGLAVEVESGARRLRSAGAYPLLLAASLVVCGGIVAGAAFPALGQLPGAGPQSLGALTAGAAFGTAALLVVLAALVFGRVQVPWLSSGWIALERYAVLRSLVALGDAGVELPAALRGSAVWASGRGRRAARALAASLDAGTTTPASTALLDPFEARMLAGAAATGTWGDAARALSTHHAVRLQRVLPDSVARIHAAALVLAGLALTAVGATFFWAYSHALVG